LAGPVINLAKEKEKCEVLITRRENFTVVKLLVNSQEIKTCNNNHLLHFCTDISGPTNRNTLGVKEDEI